MYKSNFSNISTQSKIEVEFDLLGGSRICVRQQRAYRKTGAATQSLRVRAASSATKLPGRLLYVSFYALTSTDGEVGIAEIDRRSLSSEPEQAVEKVAVSFGNEPIS